jgi:hypothetical protein
MSDHSALARPGHYLLSDLVQWNDFGLDMWGRRERRPALRLYAALRKGTTTAGADGVVAKSDHACIIGLRFSISLLRW